MNHPTFDCTIVGGGIVGLSTAMALTKKAPRLRVILLEKEEALASHQTGRNSGVIHSGIYYRPGSLKAKLCREGAKALTQFCRHHGIRTEFPGKVIVAIDSSELPRLAALYERGLANGIPGLRLIGPQELRELEPHAAGQMAVHVPSAGIVNYTEVAHAFARITQSQGGTIQRAARLLHVSMRAHHFLLTTSRGPIVSKTLVSCGGLFADRLCRMMRLPSDIQIFPFRGEYYELLPHRRALVKGLIYPVPEPQLPFLGVHFSRRIDGGVEAGPNAVLAFKREGYRKIDWNLQDLWEMLAFPGFWKMLRRHGRTGLAEMIRSLLKPIFVKSLARLIPEIGPQDLAQAPSGVRAQALNRSGELLDDFCLLEGPRMLHVVNAPSPAATASIAIGEEIAEKALRQFQLS